MNITFREYFLNNGFGVYIQWNAIAIRVYDIFKNDKFIFKIDVRLSVEEFIDFLINKHNDFNYIPDFFFEYKGTELEWYEFSISFEEFIDYMRNEQKNKMIEHNEVCLETSENCCAGELENTKLTIENAEQKVKELEDKVFEAYKHILDDSIAPKMPKDLKISFINYIADYSTGKSIKSRLMEFCGLSEELESPNISWNKCIKDIFKVVLCTNKNNTFITEIN